MENTIRETLKGLGLALDARKEKVTAIETKDDTEIIEAKRAELQKEMDEKLNAFIADIDNEKKTALDKLNRDIDTINELIGEYEDQLKTLEETKEEVAEDIDGETETAGGEEVEQESVVEGKEVEQQTTIFGQPVPNAFRP